MLNLFCGGELSFLHTAYADCNYFARKKMAKSVYFGKDGFRYRCVDALDSRIHCDMADFGGTDDAVAGYEESYTVSDFLRATRYDSYENMTLPFSFGFAFGLFHKNTIYTIQN